MPEKKHRDPFEQHINSESFDISNLESGRQRSPIELELDEFFATLPNELTHELWDTELDERQQLLCAHLTTRLAEDVMHKQFGDMLEDLSEDQLISILTVPVTVSMLVEERLHSKPKQKERSETIAPHDHRDEFSELPPNWGDILNEWFLKAKDFIINFFRRH